MEIFVVYSENDTVCSQNMHGGEKSSIIHVDWMEKDFVKEDKNEKFEKSVDSSSNTMCGFRKR